MRLDRALSCIIVLAGLGIVACATTSRPPAVAGMPGVAVAPTPLPTPTPEPTPEPEVVEAVEAPQPTPEPMRPVMSAERRIGVSVWSEPRQLPAGGGQAQILVRVRTRSNEPAPGVEVRLATDEGQLYSQGRLLVTDARGMTRDRLTTNRSARVTVNAGGVIEELFVSVGENVGYPSFED
jgi:hypothetical protein